MYMCGVCCEGTGGDEYEVCMCRVSCKEIVGGERGMRMCGIHCEETGGDEYEVCMCQVIGDEIGGDKHEMCAYVR